MTERIHNFKQSNIIGKTGEEIVLNWIRNRSNIRKITDVSTIEKYRDEDIDCILEFTDNKKKTGEIKTDTYLSGNIFYETVSNLEYGTLGCMEKSKADYLFYYFINSDELYIIDFPKYKKWFNENKHRFDCKKLKNKNKRENGIYNSIGYTIPKVLFEREFNAYKKFKIQEMSA